MLDISSLLQPDEETPELKFKLSEEILKVFGPGEKLDPIEVLQRLRQSWRRVTQEYKDKQRGFGFFIARTIAQKPLDILNYDAVLKELQTLATGNPQRLLQVQAAPIPVFCKPPR